jgi:aminoglycoside 6-adenylyltransferase
MIEWHSLTANPVSEKTWYGGRYLGDWADERWLPALRRAWPRFDPSEAWDALFETLELFSKVAIETARTRSYTYPADAELKVRGWIEARRTISLEH